MFFLNRIAFPVFRLFVRRVVGLVYLPKEGAFIVAIKHIGSLDGFMVAAVIMPYLKREIFFFANNPNWLGGWWKRVVAEKWFKTLSYDKKDALENANEILQSKKIVGIFPEGRLEEVHAGRARGKTGAARLAIWNKVPIVPIGIHHRVSKKIGLKNMHSRPKAIKNFFQHPRSFEIHIGQTFTLEEFYDKKMDKQMLQDATEKIMKRLNVLSRVEMA